MTAEIVQFPAPKTVAELLREAWEVIDRDAHLTSRIPPQYIHALRAPEAGTVALTFNGAPVALTKVAGALTPEEVYAAWEEICAAAPPAGSRIHIAGGRVLVDLPDAIGGAA